MKNIAVILSGGMGARFGGTLPKQFTKLAGKAVIEYTVEAFEKSLNIDEIIIVSHPSYVDLIWKFVKKINGKKLQKFLMVEKSDLIQPILHYKVLREKITILIFYFMMQ